jgi:putative SOS response-associated peptidase YedK
MCGRYSLVNNKDALEKYFKQKLHALYRGPNYNVSPTQSVPVLTANGFEDMRWGLIPQWAKSMNTGYTMINAVAETLPEKPTYKGPLRDQRCIIPASGFYEWLTTDNGKVPYYFHLKSREIFGFAGLYVVRKDSEGRDLKTFTIITTEPNDVVKPVHDRMPVILTQENEKIWLNPDLSEPEDVMGVLRSYDPDDMVAYPVSKDVGNAKNNRPDLIKPL